MTNKSKMNFATEASNTPKHIRQGSAEITNSFKKYYNKLFTLLVELQALSVPGSQSFNFRVDNHIRKLYIGMT